MPEISRFYGIVIAMFYNDHNPPHFHAYYGSHAAQMRIDPPGTISGSLPPRALALVIEWAVLRREELLADWNRARSRQPMEKIEPLK
jgi:hypothetical protein